MDIDTVCGIETDEFITFVFATHFDWLYNRFRSAYVDTDMSSCNTFRASFNFIKEVEIDCIDYSLHQILERVKENRKVPICTFEMNLNSSWHLHQAFKHTSPFSVSKN